MIHPYQEGQDYNMAVTYNTRSATDSLVFNVDFKNIKTYPGSGQTFNNSVGGDVTSFVNSGGGFTPDFSQSNNGFQLRESTQARAYFGAADYGIMKSSNTTGQWTMEVFFKFYNCTSGNGNVWMGEQTLLGRLGCHSGIQFYDNLLYGHIKTNDCWNGALWTGPHTLVNGNIYHVVFTYNNRVGKLYVNGSPASSNPTGAMGASYTVGHGDNNLCMGISGFVPNVDVYIARGYQKELSQSEITQNFNALRVRYGI